MPVPARISVTLSVTNPISRYHAVLDLGRPFQYGFLHLPIKPRIQLHQLLADGFDLLLGRQGLRGFDPLLEGGVEVGELGRGVRLAELASVVFLPELGGRPGVRLAARTSEWS